MEDSPSTSTGPAPTHQMSETRPQPGMTGQTDGHHPSMDGHHPSMTEKAREQSRDMAADMRERAMHQGDSQTRKAADTLRQWADDLQDMAEQARPDAPARKIVAQAADGGHRAADALEERGFSGLTEGLQSFARTRPTLFLGSAALAGLVVGRLARASVKASGGTRSEQHGRTVSPDYGRPPGTDLRTTDYGE